MIEIVPNEPQYFDFIRTLRNDERVKSGFIGQAPITPEQQNLYMAEHADDYIVAICDGVPAGYAGSVDDDIRVCTHPDFQGRGIGRALLEVLIERFPDSHAKVKVENVASLKLFESCGFTKTYVLLKPPSGRRSLASGSIASQPDSPRRATPRGSETQR